MNRTGIAIASLAGLLTSGCETPSSSSSNYIQPRTDKRALTTANMPQGMATHPTEVSRSIHFPHFQRAGDTNIYVVLKNMYANTNELPLVVTTVQGVNLAEGQKDSLDALALLNGKATAWQPKLALNGKGKPRTTANFSHSGPNSIKATGKLDTKNAKGNIYGVSGVGGNLSVNLDRQLSPVAIEGVEYLAPNVVRGMTNIGPFYLINGGDKRWNYAGPSTNDAHSYSLSLDNAKIFELVPTSREVIALQQKEYTTRKALEATAAAQARTNAVPKKALPTRTPGEATIK